MVDRTVSTHRRLLLVVLLLLGLEFLLAALLHDPNNPDGRNPYLGLLYRPENLVSDAFVRLHANSLEADEDVVIIDINEYSINRMAPLAGRYPWPRVIYAELLEGVLAQKPKAVAFDILLVGDDLASNPDSDNYLAEVIASSDNVYFPINLLDEDNIQPSEIIFDEWGEKLGFIRTDKADPNETLEVELPYKGALVSGRLGIINFIKDQDEVGRRYAIYRDRNGWQIPSLPARLARDIGYTLPQGKDILLHWRGNNNAHPKIPYYDLYADLTSEKSQRPANELTDKIVIIGGTASSLYDFRNTPISSEHPGVEILAMAIDNIKNKQHMQRVPEWLFIPGMTILLLLAIYKSFSSSHNPFRIFIGMLLMTPVILYAGFFAITQYILLPVLTPLVFAWIYYALGALNEYLQERRTRQRSVDMFGRFLDPHVVEDLVNEGEEALSDYVNAGERELSVLFSDIRGFTTLSENRSAEEIVSLLNRYFSRQTHVIFAHSGTMDKFIGDAIMAFWGAPVANKAHACDAVEAALDMVDALLAFRDEVGGEIGQTFDIGIGIHSGPAVVGMIGSDNRLDYTCIGDTVNLASRIEGKTKDVGVRILVSEDTRLQCGDVFDFIPHGSYKVKGREKEVQLFEPRRRGA